LPQRFAGNLHVYAALPVIRADAARYDADAHEGLDGKFLKANKVRKQSVFFSEEKNQKTFTSSLVA
jgi:hypothetical protein